MENYIVTYQKHYRSNPTTCIVTIPLGFKGTSQEFLKLIQEQCQDHAWNLIKNYFQESKENYAGMAILNIYHTGSKDGVID